MSFWSTLVETEDGLKPIEEIEVGDLVLAYDEETGEQAYKKVVRLFRNETKEWYHIFVNGEEIVCTGGHPFYVVGEGFVEAKDLKISDKLLLSSGKCVIIEEVQVEQLATPETTYNFEVEDFHTYYVAQSKILTHNKCWKWGVICTPKVRQTIGGVYFYEKKRKKEQKILARIQNICYNGYARTSFELR